MDILTGNKLIADFDGWKYVPVSDNSFVTEHYERGEDWLNIGYEQYHSSWDWLMPVVEKIPKIIIKSTAFYNPDYSPRIEIVPSGYVKINDFKDTPITTNVSIEGSLIKAVWLAVVRFLQWYNSQNPKQ